MTSVWYAAYGSNMCYARFACYLEGGCPPGGTRDHVGCRDPSAPRDHRPVHLPGSMYFAQESRTWGGGVAFYDPETPGPTPGRAYLVTEAQFCDVVAQEMRREPGVDLDLTEVVENGRQSVGPGWYETLVRAGSIDGVPVLTFTAPWPAGSVAWTAPSAAYLTMIGRGLREAHRWDVDAVADHLCGLPGVCGVWTPGALADLLRTG